MFNCRRMKHSILFIVLTFVFVSEATFRRKCHDCTDKTCDDLITDNLTGKCTTKPHGKCFIRQDSNGITYRGCADEGHFPNLDYEYVGCKYQQYMAWDEKPILWCFCDFNLCNTNISAVKHHYEQKPNHKKFPAQNNKVNSGFTQNRQSQVAVNINSQASNFVSVPKSNFVSVPKFSKGYVHSNQFPGPGNQHNNFNQPMTFQPNKQQIHFQQKGQQSKSQVKLFRHEVQKGQMHVNQQHSSGNPTFSNKGVSNQNINTATNQLFQPGTYHESTQFNQGSVNIPQQTQHHQITVQQQYGTPNQFNPNVMNLNQNAVNLHQRTVNQNPANQNQNPVNPNQNPVYLNPNTVNRNQNPANLNPNPVNFNPNPINYNPNPININQHPINQIQPPTGFNPNAPNSNPNQEIVYTNPGNNVPSHSANVNQNQVYSQHLSNQNFGNVQHQQNEQLYQNANQRGQQNFQAVEQQNTFIPQQQEYNEGQTNEAAILEQVMQQSQNNQQQQGSYQNNAFQQHHSDQIPGTFDMSSSQVQIQKNVGTNENQGYFDFQEQQQDGVTPKPDNGKLWDQIIDALLKVDNNVVEEQNSQTAHVKTCTGGQIWTECGGCDMSCKGVEHCDVLCEPKCQCPPELPVLHNSKCITPLQCQKQQNIQSQQSGGQNQQSYSNDDQKLTDYGIGITIDTGRYGSNSGTQTGNVNAKEMTVSNSRSGSSRLSGPNVVCRSNQVYNECGSACTKTCDNYSQLICTRNCVAHCECPTHVSIWHNNQCITEQQCPQPTQNRCQGNQEWKDCGKPCTPICSNTNPICPRRCQPRCQCPRDKPILHNGQCITTRQCPIRLPVDSIGFQNPNIETGVNTRQLGQLGSSSINTRVRSRNSNIGVEKQGPETNVYAQNDDNRILMTEITNVVEQNKGCYSGACHHICQFINNKPVCSCRNGFDILEDGKTCKDKNECDVNNGGCSDGCENNRGSYRCHCPEGWLLESDQHTCVDIDECATNNGGCSYTCENTIGSYGCQCPSGFTLQSDEHTCEDLNECEINNGGCSHKCENNLGSYLCHCPVGFLLQTNGKMCTDINECDNNNGGCTHRCENNLGSFLCHCPSGFRLLPDQLTCEDIDECQFNNAGCSFKCENVPGSYSCHCPNGFLLQSDQHTCELSDPCLRNNGGCSDKCTSVPNGGYRCECPNRYRLDGDGKTCIDVNECEINNGGCGDLCVNEPGTYHCACTGDLYRIATDDRSCLAFCPEGFIKSESLQSCYKVFQSKDEVRTVTGAQQTCKEQHPNSSLVDIESPTERLFLRELLSTRPTMLEGWQGWWTSGSFVIKDDGANQFQWSTGSAIPNDSNLWGFKKTPYKDTCIWILQISVYDYTVGNYDCATESGFVCEINLPQNKIMA